MDDIAQKIIDSARQKKLTIATAESVTGGMIAAALTSVPGSSEVFLCGVVAYAEDAKIRFLGVDRDEIHTTHGYSAHTAQQMAERIRMRNSADVSISTTGCAGPEAVEGFENGRVIFGLAKRGEETVIFDEQFAGDRGEVRKKATGFALEKILRSII